MRVIISMVPELAQWSYYYPMAAPDECIPVMLPFNLTPGKGKSTERNVKQNSMSSCLVGKEKGIWGLMGSESYCFLAPSVTLPSCPAPGDLRSQLHVEGYSGSRKSREPQLWSVRDLSSRPMSPGVSYSFYKHLFISHLFTKWCPGGSLKHF